MSVQTIVKHGQIVNIDVPLTILPKYTDKEVEFNPGLCRDPDGTLWISFRTCITDQRKLGGLEHPVHYMNFLYIGKLDEKTLKVTEIKEIKPESKYDGFEWNIEDVRLFWRKDGLHGIGVILPIKNGEYHTCQAEILIDHSKGTYKLIKDHGQPQKRVEKNWSPPESATEAFDFAYSTAEIIKDGVVSGIDDHLAVHNGTKLLPYKDGYIQLSHVISGVNEEKTYATIAVRRDKNGYGTHLSQLFHFNVGWREKLKETVEFVSDMVWSKDKEGEELLVVFGVEKAVIVAHIPIEKLIWDNTTDIMWYKWRWDTPPNRIELKTPKRI